MSPEDAPATAREDAPAARRRTLLRRLGAGSVLALGGVRAAAAQPDRSPPEDANGRPPADAPPDEVAPRRYEPDVDDLPEVESAAVAVDGDGSVSTRLRIDAGTVASESQATADGRTLAQYSIGLEPESERPGSSAGPDAPNRSNETRAARGRGHADARGRPDHAALRPVVRKDARAVDLASSGDVSPDGDSGTDGGTGAGGGFQTQTHYDGIDDVPAAGDRDVVAFGQTESQECGPLARTSVLADALETSSRTYYYGAAADRESTDGDACVGHEWDATFEAFCDYLGWVPGYDCAVPSAFDTTWRVEAADRSGTHATTVFSCANFPAIPDTVVAAHDVALVDGESGPAVEFGATVGVVAEFDASDYELDANGVSNLIVDGLAVAFPGVRSVYSHALATYLLKHDAGVVV